MVKKRAEPSRNKQIDRLDKLPWKSSFPTNDDPFAIFADNQEGGFLSLEEIDESEYNLVIPPFEQQTEEESSSGKASKLKKRKRAVSDGDKDDDEIAREEEIGEEGDVEMKKDKKKKKKKKKAKQIEKQVVKTNDEDVEESVDEDEFNAWNELRLHPLLMKAIYKLGFKEPTPIQQACIPAAAHQGKDVIGAAETGSGKTLAFGLPILQRLLEEQDKVGKLMIEDEEAADTIAPRSLLRALIITPTRELALQVTDHLKAAARTTKVRVVSIVGGMSTEKQERLLRARPEIVVGTPGRLWELMSGGDKHLIELHSLSFFVLDEADRMIENGHFQELQSIIDMLPVTSGATDIPTDVQNSNSSVPRKKRQTFVFSATIALSSDFRKKLKRGKFKSAKTEGLSSLENLSEKAGMKPDAAIIDLTSASIMTSNLEESFLECKEEDKDAYLYYILCVHGQGRTIVFCTSIAALRHVTALLRLVNINVGTIHAQMQQRARLKAMDRFRENENGILVATDVVARGVDIAGVRTVIHYQLPHSAEVYVHRSGRTARAHTDGCSVALVSSNDRLKFATLCKSFAKEEVYMVQLPGFVAQGEYGRVCRLRKSLYGLKQSPRAWFDTFSEAVEKFGMIKCMSDHSVFYKRSNIGIILLVVYVDDIVITGSDIAGISSLKSFIHAQFHTKDLGMLKYFLGVEVTRSKKGIFLSQRKYVLDLLSETGKLGAKPCSAPMTPNMHLTGEGELFGDPERYRRLVGKLNYLTVTRPDIAYSVSVVSQFLSSPTVHHWTALEQILCYLKGAPGRGILYANHGHNRIECFSDAD